MLARQLTRIRKNLPSFFGQKVALIEKKALPMALSYRFSGERDKPSGDLNVKEEPITISQADIEIIRQIVQDKNGESGAEAEKDFFGDEETSLSLRLMQIESIAQLKPILTQYAAKPIPAAEKEAGQLLRCKFIVLYKHINLKGSVASPLAFPLFRQLAQHAHRLQEEFLTIFYRIVAEDVAADSNSPLLKELPKVPIISKPSHCNSELLSLMLMVHPMQEDQLYINYHLVEEGKEQQFSEGRQEPTKQKIYDPVHMVHIYRHMRYYEDIQRLTNKSLGVKDIEEDKYSLEETIKTQQQLQQRQIQAICSALEHEMHELCNKYLFESCHIIKNISLLNAINLLRAILTVRDSQKYPQTKMKEIVRKLLTVLISKPEQAIEFSEEEQLRENQGYLKIIEVVTVILTRGQKYIDLGEVHTLMSELFRVGSFKWRVKFDEYVSEELFEILVCYKACRDLMAKGGVTLDQGNQLLAQILANFREELESKEVDPKQVFYACHFADTFGCLQYLSSDAVTHHLKKFAKQATLNPKAQELMDNLLNKIQEM